MAAFNGYLYKYYQAGITLTDEFIQYPGNSGALLMGLLGRSVTTDGLGDPNNAAFLISLPQRRPVCCYHELLLDSRFSAPATA
jgi:hypothetical protein